MCQKLWVSLHRFLHKSGNLQIPKRNAPGYLNIRVSVCIIHFLKTKFCQNEVQRLKVKKKEKERIDFHYLFASFRNSVSARVIKFSIARHNSKRTPVLVEVCPSTFVLDVKYAAFATPRIMASPIIDSIAECRSGVYDRRELSFLLSRFNVWLVRAASQ